MATPTTKTELLNSQLKELVKTYAAYDGNGRPTFVYTAQADCPDQGPCIKTAYTYLDSTSTLVTKRKESYDVWIAATYD